MDGTLLRELALIIILEVKGLTYMYKKVSVVNTKLEIVLFLRNHKHCNMAYTPKNVLKMKHRYITGNEIWNHPLFYIQKKRKDLTH